MITSRRVTRSRRRWESTHLGSPGGRSQAAARAGQPRQGSGDFEGARSLYEEALALARTTGATRDVAALLNNLGVVAKLQGALEDARSLFEESLVHKAPLGDRRGLAVSHSNLGALAVDRADAAEAAVHYGLATELFRGSTRPTAWCSASGVSPRRRPCAGTRPSPSSSSPLMTLSATGWAIPFPRRPPRARPRRRPRPPRPPRRNDRRCHCRRRCARHRTRNRPGPQLHPPTRRGTMTLPRGRGSVGRASPCQGEGRGFESRRPLHAGLAEASPCHLPEARRLKACRPAMVVGRWPRPVRARNGSTCRPSLVGAV